jgi:uncharacterized protein (DUF427 family)
MTEKKVLVPGPDHPITIEPTDARVTVRAGGRVIADTAKALTLQEAAYPPVQYIPLADVDPGVLEPSDHTSYCPYKGDASYYSLKVGEEVAPAAVWTYVRPHDSAAAIAGHVAFYPDRVDVIEVHDGA